MAIGSLRCQPSAVSKEGYGTPNIDGYRVAALSAVSKETPNIS